MENTPKAKEQPCHQCGEFFPYDVLVWQSPWVWCKGCLRRNAQKKIGIPAKYADSTLDRWGNLSPEVMKAINSDQSLYVCADTGRGKTDLVLSVLNAKLDWDMIPSMLFWEWEWLLHSITDKKSREGRPVNDIMRQAMNVTYLVLDDLGGIRDDYRAKEFELSILWKIINDRYANRRWIAVTSNKTLESLADTFDARIASRLAEMCFKFTLPGGDRRVR